MNKEVDKVRVRELMGNMNESFSQSSSPRVRAGGQPSGLSGYPGGPGRFRSLSASNIGLDGKLRNWIRGCRR
jgi:hypothetical protein